MDELNKSDLAQKMRELKKTIADIDRTEHSSLDAAAWQAYSYLPVWALDQVREGSPGVLGLSDGDITSSHADA